jgi:type 1 glutamine amidotransferase
MAIRTLLVLLCCFTVSIGAEPDRFDRSGLVLEEVPSDPSLAKIVLIAGYPSPKLKTGEHEYFAGCALLMKMLKQTPGVFPVLVDDGWPKKPETLKGAKAIVLFVEGAQTHSALKGDRFAELKKLAEAGVGIVHLHSAIDYPNDFGDRVRQIAGAHWQKGHSLRAHWVAKFETFPDHPVMRGVTPFEIDDGWLWKVRFANEMKGVTPLLRTVNPKDPPGKTSEPDSTIAWAYDRSGGGKSFTFTGGHLHESLKLDGYRKFLVNGILWSAGKDIPKDGAACQLDPADLHRHYDVKKPAKK